MGGIQEKRANEEGEEKQEKKDGEKQIMSKKIIILDEYLPLNGKCITSNLFKSSAEIIRFSRNYA